MQHTTELSARVRRVVPPFSPVPRAHRPGRTRGPQPHPSPLRRSPSSARSSRRWPSGPTSLCVPGPPTNRSSTRPGTEPRWTPSACAGWNCRKGLPRISSDNTTLRDYLALKCSLLPELLLPASTWYRAGQGEASSVAAGPLAPRRPVRWAAAHEAPTPRLDEILTGPAEHPRASACAQRLSRHRQRRRSGCVRRRLPCWRGSQAPEYTTATAALLDATNAADFGMPSIPL